MGEHQGPTSRLYLMGPARLERDGAPARFETRKGLALLAYLALEGPQSRDHLAGLLWPDAEIDRARGALRRTLSAVRSAADDTELLDAQRDRVAVRREHLWTDVLEFRAHLDNARARTGAEARDSLESAVGLARPDLLAGLAVRGAPDFEYWQQRTEESLRRDLAQALARLVELYFEAGQFEPAIAHARRWNELDPLHELAHRWLMRLYSETGDRAAAIEQYRQCVRVLSEELAVAPVEETTRLYESLSAEGPTPIPVAPIPDPTTAEELPLIGRAREIEILKSVAAAKSRLVVIEGEAGIGKTRLSRVLSGIVTTEGRGHVEVRCHEEESGHAFGVATRLLHRALDSASTGTVRTIESSSASEARRLVPDLVSLREDLAEPPSLDSPGARTAFFYGAWDTLLTLLGPRPLILIDDVQWADAGSLELLAYGLRRLETMPALVALTWRIEEIGPDHLLRRLLADALRADSAHVFALGRLSTAEVAELVTRARPELAASAERLFAETEGVPLFIAEYLRAVSPEGEWPLARGITELVRAQTARLSDLATQMLTAASVVGRDLTPELLESVSGRSAEETATAVEELERRGLLAIGSTPRQTYDFAHEKVRQVVYADTSLARRRLLHARAFTHLEARGEMSLAAHHAHQAGRHVEAARLYAAAGVRARGLFANEEAHHHLETAIGLGHPEPAGLHEELGDVQTLLGRYQDAESSYGTALAFGTEDERARLERKLASLFLRRGEEERAESHLRAALEDAVDPVERGEALADLALATAGTGLPGAMDLAEEALVVAEEAGDDAGHARALNVLGLLEHRQGHLDEARSRLRQGIAVAARLSDPSLRVAALNNLALVESDSANYEIASKLLAEALALCERQGDLHRAAALHNNLADVSHRAGSSADSRDHSRRAAELFAQVGEDPVRQPGIWKLVSW